MSRLWYRQPAGAWEEALPLGNGRLGAMVYGGAAQEHIQVNEESMWYGGPADRNNPDAREQLPVIRELIFEGRIAEAERLIRLSLSGCPESMHPYQSLGDIHIEFEGMEGFTDYERELDLEQAVYRQKFRCGETFFEREAFITAPSDVMAVRFTARGKEKLSFSAILRRSRFFDGVKKTGNDGICLFGNLGKGGFDFSMILSAESPDGKVSTMGEYLLVSDASEVTLYFCADTTYHVSEEELEASIQDRIKRAKKKGFEALRREHVEDYRALYGRVRFELGDLSEYDAVPTNERVLAAAHQAADIGLSKLYFDYGRYLLISCSRQGTLPATLQGLWNQDMLPPWDSKYTVNINTEMNYWPAEICNLSECHMPLFELIKKMVPNGRRTAEVMYGAGGFVCHHNTDIHGDTAVQDRWLPGSYWVMGAAWLCTHQWTHYQYTLDQDFLRESFPIMRAAAEFFLDYLVEHDGYLVTCPSVSPENTFILPNGEMGANIYGVTMDNQILRDLFTQCNEAAGILGVEDELDQRIRKTKQRLIPTRIGKYGNIMEWPEDFEEQEPGHRHISHLYGLHPSQQITVDATPELAQAARVTLQRRLAAGGGHTGWSRAWITNHYARLWDGESAYENIEKLFANSTYPNLFDKHPPFQIDGNFGITAAIAEMLVQSTPDRIVLLPALPGAWDHGSMRGLCIKGCAQADVSWQAGGLTEFVIRAGRDYSWQIKYGSFSTDLVLRQGEERRLVWDGEKLGTEGEKK